MWKSFEISSVFVGLASLICMTAVAKEPVKVFILAGQSNMEGKAAVTTLDAVLADEKTRKPFQHLKTEGKWTVRDDVFVTFLDREESEVSPLHGPLTVGFGSAKNVRDENNKRTLVAGIGPELGIGWVLGEAYDEPVLLIKAAWGGRAVKQTFRPPSAMPTADELKQRLAEIQEKNPDTTLEELKESYGRDYRKIVSETQRVLKDLEKYVPNYEESQGYELAGFIWFQGWNNGVGDGNPEYTEQMAHFIRDMRRDLESPNLPFVIGELGTDGTAAEGWVAKFRSQQVAIANLPEFQGNVRLAKTAHLWPTSPDLAQQWTEFRAAAKANESKATGDPTRIDPGQFYQLNWRQKHAKELAFTSDKRYHYLGSGSCYYLMGEAMGKAMLDLQPKN
jgi:hypothetical protein